MALTLRSFLVAPAFVLVNACGADGSQGTSGDGSETATLSQAIINGIEATPDTFTGDVDRRAWSTVRVLNASYAGCGHAHDWTTGTGVLLENNVVLTVAHGVAEPVNCQPSGGPYTPAQPSRVYVYSADTPSTTLPPSCALGQCAQPMASGILMNPNGTDTALLFLSTRLKGIGGFTFGHFVPLFPFDEGRYRGRGIWCTGFGINSCSEPSSSLTQLRFGAPMVEASSDNVLTLGVLNDRIPESGDSGGPCWSMFESETNPLSVLGIVSASTYCMFQQINQNGNTFAESPPRFRTWVRSQIANRKGTSAYAFAGSSDVAWWAAYNPPGTTTNWTVQNGRFWETTDAGGAEPDGPMRFSILEIHDNADISVKVRSSDNDGAGIVFRYVDPQNYYFFYVRPQLHIARFYKRRLGSFIAYPSGTTLIQYSSTTDTTIKVELRDATFKGFINGTQVATASDGEFPTGYAGIYKWRLTEASFDDFTIVAKIPQTSVDWPISP